MQYSVHIQKVLRKKFKILKKRNWKLTQKVSEKIKEIRKNPLRYKNLRRPLHKYKRVHVAGRFVLIFSVSEKEQIITLEDFDHHDNIYRNRDPYDK